MQKLNDVRSFHIVVSIDNIIVLNDFFSLLVTTMCLEHTAEVVACVCFNTAHRLRKLEVGLYQLYIIIFIHFRMLLQCNNN